MSDISLSTSYRYQRLSFLKNWDAMKVQLAVYGVIFAVLIAGAKVFDFDPPTALVRVLVVASFIPFLQFFVQETIKNRTAAPTYVASTIVGIFGPLNAIASGLLYQQDYSITVFVAWVILFCFVIAKNATWENPETWYGTAWNIIMHGSYATLASLFTLLPGILYLRQLYPWIPSILMYASLVPAAGIILYHLKSFLSS